MPADDQSADLANQGVERVRVQRLQALAPRRRGLGLSSEAAAALVSAPFSSCIEEEGDAELNCPELPPIVGRTSVVVQPFELVLSPTMVRLLMKMKVRLPPS